MNKNLKFFILGVSLLSVAFISTLVFKSISKSKVESSTDIINNKPEITNISSAQVIANEDNKNSGEVNINSRATTNFKGKITYERSNSAPSTDNGASILIVPSPLNKDDIFMDDIYKFSNGCDFNNFRSKYSFAAKTDSNGNYKFNSIPKGNYVMICVSNNLNLNSVPDANKSSIPPNKLDRPLTAKQKELLTPLSNVLNCNMDQLTLLLFRLNKYNITEVEVNSSEAVTLDINISDKN